VRLGSGPNDARRRTRSEELPDAPCVGGAGNRISKSERTFAAGEPTAVAKSAFILPIATGDWPLACKKCDSTKELRIKRS
jgi:hypothetical protein